MPAAKFKTTDTVELRITTRLPADLMKRLKHEAESRSLYRTDIVVEALRAHLQPRRGRS